MADTVVGATVTINNKRTGGSPSGSNGSVFNLMLKELKGISGTLGKAFKLGFSGIGGGLLAGAGAAAAGGAIKGSEGGGKGLSFNSGIADIGAEFTGKLFDMVQVNEEKMIAITDILSGQIDIITLEEAKRREILDKAGNIKTHLDKQDSLFDKMTANVEKNGDAVVLNLETLKEINSTTDKQWFIEKQIEQLLLQKKKIIEEDIRQRNEKLNREFSSSVTIGTPGRQQSIAYGALTILEQAAYQNQLRTESPDVRMSIERGQSSQPRTIPLLDLVNPQSKGP